MFYKKFEDTFRGSKEDVTKKQEIYLNFLLPLLKNTNKKIIDLGCGRGEFLSLLKSHNIDGIGVDLDKHMANSSEVIIMDALEYLKTQPDNSAILITSFHMIEHIPFETLIELIKETYRVLDNEKGVLIFETPNPENLRVASEYFYLDPTHIRPIPKDLLRFTLEYYNFKTKTLFLNQAQLTNTAIDIFNGVSPDYSVVGFKNNILKIENSSITIDEILNKIKTKEEISETNISKLFQSQNEITTLLPQLQQETNSLKEEIEILKEQNKQIEPLKLELDNLKEEKNIISQQVEHLHQKMMAIELSTQQAWDNYISILNSKSFRMTKPIREVTKILKNLKHSLKSKLKKTSKPKPQKIVKKQELNSDRAKTIFKKLKKENDENFN